MNLLDRLKAGRQALRPVKINGVALALRVLTEGDYQLAGLAANSMLLAEGVELGIATADVFEAEKTLQLIALMLVDPATREPVFTSVDQAREVLLRQDKEYLSGEYLEHEKTFSPNGGNMSEAEFAALVDEVKKNPVTTTLNGLSGDQLRRLITSLASTPSI